MNKKSNRCSSQCNYDHDRWNNSFSLRGSRRENICYCYESCREIHIMRKEADGFKEAIEDEGGKVIIKHPETATADAQISVVQSLISQEVDAICIAGNDEKCTSGMS